MVSITFWGNWGMFHCRVWWPEGIINYPTQRVLFTSFFNVLILWRFTNATWRMESTDILQRFFQNRRSPLGRSPPSSAGLPWRILGANLRDPNSDPRVAIRWLNAKTHRKPLTVSRLRKDLGFQAAIASRIPLNSNGYGSIPIHTYTYHF